MTQKLIDTIYEKIMFFGPVMIVIAMSAFLVYCTFLADFVITAAVVAEEGSGSEAASAGVINALTFIIPAIIGGFIIALLFKYRRKLTLKYFFGGALFFAGTFIIYFFANSIVFIIQTQFYSIFIVNYNPNTVSFIDLPPIIYLDMFYLLIIAGCLFLGFWITYIITSQKFNKPSKNRAILVQSALMGAFLSVILPTFTVIILLVGLSLYDIYSVRRGPIKNIVQYTMEDEMNQYKNSEFDSQYYKNNINAMNGKENNHSEDFKNKKNNMFCVKSNENWKSDKDSNLDNRNIIQKPKTIKKINLDWRKDTEDVDSMLTSMTYSSRDWDVGIGDLVFYSMLASQPLTPYFIYTHGTGLLDHYGLWIFWLISFLTIIGILIGFLITIRLLERNSMLPGLPCSIALGITGFIGSTVILSLML